MCKHRKIQAYYNHPRHVMFIISGIVSSYTKVAYKKLHTWIYSNCRLDVKFLWTVKKITNVSSYRNVGMININQFGLHQPNCLEYFLIYIITLITTQKVTIYYTCK